MESMETEKWGLSGNQLIFLTYCIGAVVVALGVWKGTELNNNAQKLDDNERIKDLEATISTLDEENKRKQDSIKKLSKEIV